jgi:hypothetical protein
MYGEKLVCDRCKEHIVAGVVAAQERPDLIQLHAAWALARVQTYGDLHGRGGGNIGENVGQSD